ncbi:MAG: hypothetical protein M9904_00200 [Chitinophagaceae bacterium]|nr:hypothetical protein [Chitinophagaceae bacterium]
MAEGTDSRNRPSALVVVPICVLLTVTLTPSNGSLFVLVTLPLRLMSAGGGGTRVTSCIPVSTDAAFTTINCLSIVYVKD